MSDWFILLVIRSYKTVTEDDVKMPLVLGEGKKVSVCICVHACVCVCVCVCDWIIYCDKPVVLYLTYVLINNNNQ